MAIKYKTQRTEDEQYIGPEDGKTADTPGERMYYTGKQQCGKYITFLFITFLQQDNDIYR